MNIHADALAKHQLWADIDDDLPDNDCPHMKHTTPIASILQDNDYHAIVSRGQRTVLQHLAKNRTTFYWTSKNRPFNNPTIDKEVLGHATRNLPIHDSRWISKWSSGHCGVGVKLQQWREQPHSKCPRCSTDHETVDHVLCCKHEDATSIWTTGLEDIRMWMQQHHCVPDLDFAVCTRLAQWRSNTTLTSLHGLSDEILSLIDEVDNLGWRNFCFGLIPKSWSNAQEQYLRSINRKQSGVSWMSQLLRRLWKIQKNLWLDRNKHLHNNGRSIHEYERMKVDQEIQREFSIGQNGLPEDFGTTFSGQVTTVLEKEDVVKLQWLALVWYARDIQRSQIGLGPWPKDAIAANFISKFHLRRKRNRG